MGVGVGVDGFFVGVALGLVLGDALGLVLGVALGLVLGVEVAGALGVVLGVAVGVALGVADGVSADGVLAGLVVVLREADESGSSAATSLHPLSTTTPSTTAPAISWRRCLTMSPFPAVSALQTRAIRGGSLAVHRLPAER
ncbi:hypothetical protein Kfla_4648 [Kribbella flavida DSM 17836]|uniref:Glycine zipper domain-containing protein n=1 Tax=Kribbella flavida (strain DSM 17836 / JCM 10339 / NBRC 14399) TaxID=479435 RepID=D2PY60_KRIFD|nr:hypothetical protein Kfla_4648 [Kribbella flavida DSM 17836]